MNVPTVTIADLKKLWIESNTPVVYAGPTEKFDHQNDLELAFDEFVFRFTESAKAVALKDLGEDAVFRGISGLGKAESQAEKEKVVQAWIFYYARTYRRKASA